jgi:hypothetical protein
MPKKTTTNSLSLEFQGKLNRGPIDVPIVHTLYQLYISWNDLVIKFPKSQRYTLGQTCQDYLLALIEAVITAAGTSEPAIKRDQLQTASAKLDLLRLLFRLAKDCKCLANKDYLSLESSLHEAGRMLGGWRKSLR